MRSSGCRAAALAVLVISSISAVIYADAAPEKVRLGECNVSFDLKTDIDYKLVLASPMTAGGAYGLIYNTYDLGVIGKENALHIVLTEYNRIIQVDPASNREVVLGLLQELQCTSINMTDEVIDGRPAVLGGGYLTSNNPVFVASYSPDGFMNDTVMLLKYHCRLASTFPVEETRSLLQTIHVQTPWN